VRLQARNHRGVELPVVLGLVVVLITLVPTVLAAGREQTFGVALGLVLVALGGLLDDWWGSHVRGIRGHLSALARGRMTTGILKILAGFAAAGLAIAEVGGSVGRMIVGVFVIAGATNLWNVLDVAPGRALKVFVPVQALLLWGLWDTAFAVPAGASLVAALAVLPFDLRERAMLGDAGSNPLGFLVGVGLYARLSAPALGIALVVILGLQFLAETITLSRVIGSAPPLRWYDRLGRLREPKSSPDSSPDG
jgi:UDP-N-acetylmuramyl pentapeptide phosphotransferase/UDP-N-acetylglucosamine-1-phosphate transferase